MGDNGECEILFHGFQTFWKTRISLELAIVHHKRPGVVEVIAYDPHVQQEAPRLYLNTDLIEKKFNKSVMQTNLADEREKCTRHRTEFDEHAANATIEREMLKEYVLSRLQMKSTDSNWYMVIQPSFTDGIDPLTGLIDTQLVNRPDGLLVANIQHIPR